MRTPTVCLVPVMGLPSQTTHLRARCAGIFSLALDFCGASMASGQDCGIGVAGESAHVVFGLRVIIGETGCYTFAGGHSRRVTGGVFLTLAGCAASIPSTKTLGKGGLYGTPRYVSCFVFFIREAEACQ